MSKLSQITKLGQRKVLSQQTRLAIKILQLNSLDLHKEIDNLILENPFLEKIDEINLNYDLTLPANSNNSNVEDILKYHQDSDNLREFLTKQLRTSAFSDEEKKIASLIINSVDDNGYLTEDLREIFIQANKLLEVSFQDIFYILHTLQRFEPIGTCSIDLCDSLKIQLHHSHKESSNYKDAIKILEYLDNIQINDKSNFDQIIKQIINDKKFNNDALNLIRKLNPKPGLEISAKLDTHQISPDVIIFKRDGKWIAELTKNSPMLTLNRDYVSLLNQSKIKTDLDYLNKNHNAAKFIINSIKNRNITILNVCREIFKKQHTFLDNGEIGMIPMTLKEISDLLQIHESTVSRATNNKYVQTPRGVFELKYFFSSELNTETGKMISSRAIIKMIDEIIKDEDKRKPWSDQKLSEYFTEKGISVARRTITKYREKLKLPNSTERKIK
tara:strand:- start:13225 stop:14556 length:1332 start_codon:yes stop_codon:yes gene_type:complete